MSVNLTALEVIKEMDTWRTNIDEIVLGYSLVTEQNHAEDLTQMESVQLICVEPNTTKWGDYVEKLDMSK
jgi:hypothetical protein